MSSYSKPGMSTTTAVPDSEAIAQLRRRVDDLEVRVAALGQMVAPPAVRAKVGWRAQVGAFGDDPGLR